MPCADTGRATGGRIDLAAASALMLRVMVSVGAAQALILFVALARAKSLSVMLGADGYGVVSTIDQAVVSLVQLGGLSLPLVAMKFMARSHSDGAEAFERTFIAFFRALAALGVLAVLGGYALFVWFPGMFGPDLAALRDFFVLAILAVPAMILNIHFVQTLAAAQLPGESVWLNMLVQGALAVATIAGVWFGGIAGLYGATTGTGIALSVGALVYLHRRLGVDVRRQTPGAIAELRASPAIASYSLLLYVALASYSLAMFLTRYFAFVELGARDAGLLQAILGIALTLAAIPNAMNAHFFAPLVNRRAPVTDKMVAANSFAAKVLVALTIGGVAVALFPRLLLTLLFSTEFVSAAPVLFAFVLWQCLYQLGNVYLQLLVGLDDVGYYAFASVLAYGGAALLLRPAIGSMGLAGTTVAFSVTMAMAMMAAYLRLRVRFGVTISRPVGLRAILCLGAVAGAGMLFDPMTESTSAGMALRVGYALLVAAFVWITLSADERSLATRLLPRWRSA
jgi:O-antigen/teichoic acid export membrane protein